MNILLIYETYSSGTYSASLLAKHYLETYGHSVDVQQLRYLDTSVNISAYDLLILSTPSWWERKQDGQPHINFLRLMETEHGFSLKGMPTALFGLGDSTYARFCHGVEILEQYVKDHGAKIVIDTLKIDGFYFNQEENEKQLQAWVANLNQKINT